MNNSKLFLSAKTFLMLSLATLLYQLAYFLVLRVWHTLLISDLAHLIRFSAFYRSPASNNLGKLIGEIPVIWACLVSSCILYIAYLRRGGKSWAAILGALIIAPFFVIAIAVQDFATFLRFAGILIVVTLGLVILVPSAIFFGDYVLNAHRYSADGNCAPIAQVLSASHILRRCVNTSDAQDNTNIHVAFFMSKEIYPGPVEGQTGHAWLALAAIKKVNDHYLLTDKRVIGYGFDSLGPAPKCQKWLEGLYRFVRPLVPRGIDAFLTTWYCRAPHIGPEGPEYHNAQGMPIGTPASPSDIDSFLGHHPDRLLSVAISADQYDAMNEVVDEQLSHPPPYQLLYHDCTTFIIEVSEFGGLYHLPRILTPFPSDVVRSMMLTNSKENGE